MGRLLQEIGKRMIVSLIISLYIHFKTKLEKRTKPLKYSKHNGRKILNAYDSLKFDGLRESNQKHGKTRIKYYYCKTIQYELNCDINTNIGFTVMYHCNFNAKGIMDYIYFTQHILGHIYSKQKHSPTI